MYFFFFFFFLEYRHLLAREEKFSTMATKNPEAVIESEKGTRHYDEKTDLESIKPVAGGNGNADYTGSVAKTDPREIALVRKIDWRLMVCLYTARSVTVSGQETDRNGCSPRCVPCTSS